MLVPSVNSEPWSPPWRRIALRVLFGAWIVSFIVVGAYLLAPHLLTLPVPQPTDAALLRTTAERLPAERGRWMALHILDQDCPCSVRVLDHLLAQPRPTTVAERIVWIASVPDPRRIAEIRAHGFDLDLVAPEQLSDRYHVEAAPLLVVVDPADRVHYLGGYTPRKQASDVRDAAIIAAVLRGDRVAPLPTFGCAVGASLRTTIDPLGIRRWN